MRRQTRKITKRVLSLLLVIFLISINCFAAVVSDNDGSAFITKAEFDSLKSNFQSQIDQYNTSIDSKIDGAIASYLSGLQLTQTMNRQVLGYDENGTLCPLDDSDLQWQQGDMGLHGSAIQINWSILDLTEADIGKYNVESGLRNFSAGRSPTQYGLNFTEAPNRRKFKNRLIKNVDYRTGVAEWVGYGETDDSLQIASNIIDVKGMSFFADDFKGQKYAIGSPGYGWGGSEPSNISATAHSWHGRTPVEGSEITRDWAYSDYEGFSNVNFTGTDSRIGRIQMYRGQPTADPTATWGMTISSLSSVWTRNVSNLNNQSIISLHSDVAVSRLGTNDTIRDFMNDTDMTDHEFNFNYGKNYSAKGNFIDTFLISDAKAGSYNESTGEFKPSSATKYKVNQKMPSDKNIGIACQRLTGDFTFINNDLGYARGSGNNFIRYNDDRDKRNAYSDLYFGFVKPTDKWSKLWTSKYDNNLTLLKSYSPILNTLKNTCYYTADEFAPGDNSEHLSINAGLPICEVESGETITFSVHFADAGNYNLWVKRGSFVDEKKPWDDECVSPNDITDAQGNKYPVGYGNNSIKLTGIQSHFIKFDIPKQGYIFIKWSKADGINDTKGGGTIYLSDSAQIVKNG